MINVFVVRPFGIKPVTIRGKDGKDTSVDVNFDEIDRLLIKAALAKNGLEGVTTEVIAEAGNIRVDMFQMLITHHLVIADISIDNANVFYELGIRHGLRPKGTILLRFPTSGKDVPFDLKTTAMSHTTGKAVRQGRFAGQDDQGHHRCDAQSRAEAGQSGISAAARTGGADPAKLIVVPKEFQEAVERAENDVIYGDAMLALLGEEAETQELGA